MSVIFSNCVECIHFKYSKEDKSYSCKAFTEGIPLKYMFRKHQDENQICNNGIKFKRENIQCKTPQ